MTKIMANDVHFRVVAEQCEYIMCARGAQVWFWYDDVVVLI